MATAEIINALKEYSISCDSASTCNFPEWYLDLEDYLKEEDKEKEQKERINNIINKYGLT